MRNLFVYAVCGDRHAGLVNRSLQFLKHFSRQDILIVVSRCNVPIHHDQIIWTDSSDEFDDHQVSILLKTNLYRIIGEPPVRCCYLDSDVIAIDPHVDTIFSRKLGPISFSVDHVRMRRFSPWAVQCGCVGGECDHLREAIRRKFGIEVLEPNWQHWNGGVYVFDSESIDFLDTWHAYTRLIFCDSAWTTRDQGTLIASAWRHGLENQAPLPRAYNYIVDRPNVVGRAGRTSLRPCGYPICGEYPLDQPSDLPRTHFLHFIMDRWMHWDEIEDGFSTSGRS